MEWISSFFYSISSIFPRLINVTEDMFCLKLSGGKHKILLPGYHVYFPLFSEIRQCYKTRQEIDLPEQILTTSDGKIVLVSVSLVYRIINPIKALINTQDYEKTVTEVAQKEVKHIVTHNELSNVIVEDSEFDKNLLLGMKQDLKLYGLVVDSAFFTSAAETRSYHISGMNFVIEKQ